MSAAEEVFARKLAAFDRGAPASGEKQPLLEINPRLGLCFAKADAPSQYDGLHWGGWGYAPRRPGSYDSAGPSADERGTQTGTHPRRGAGLRTEDCRAPDCRYRRSRRADVAIRDRVPARQTGFDDPADSASLFWLKGETATRKPSPLQERAAERYELTWYEARYDPHSGPTSRRGD